MLTTSGIWDVICFACCATESILKILIHKALINTKNENPTWNWKPDFFFLMCLFEREKKRNLISIGSFPPRPPQSAMGWVEARSQELHPGLLGCLGALGKSWSVGFLNVSSRDFVPYKKGKITLKVDLFLGKQSCLWLGFIMYTLHYFCSSLCCTLFL